MTFFWGGGGKSRILGHSVFSDVEVRRWGGGWGVLGGMGGGSGWN